MDSGSTDGTREIAARARRPGRGARLAGVRAAEAVRRGAVHQSLAPQCGCGRGGSARSPAEIAALFAAAPRSRRLPHPHRQNSRRRARHTRSPTPSRRCASTGETGAATRPPSSTTASSSRRARAGSSRAPSIISRCAPSATSSAKLNAYTDALADDLDLRGERVSRLRLVLEFPANFVKAYIGRRHACAASTDL